MVEKNAGELTPHVGHQVEITGTITNVPMAGSGNNTVTQEPPNASGTAATGRMSGMMRERLQVSSIRMIAATCPAASSPSR